MNDGVKRQIRLSAIGFDGRAEESFKIAFKGMGKGRAVLVDGGRAEGSIINMDSAAAKVLWANYRERHPDMPTIILGVNDPGIEGALYVKKPATVEQMLDAIDRLISDISDSEAENSAVTEPALSFSPSVSRVIDREIGGGRDVAGAATIRLDEEMPPVTSYASKSSTPSSFYNPRDYLQNSIHSAVEYSLKSQVAVELWIMAGENQWDKIIFLPGLKKVLTSFSDGDLKQYCSMPLTLIKHKVYRREPKYTQSIEARVAKEQRGCGYEPFLWKVALFTSLGRLPQGTELGNAMKLTQWPNLTRLYPLNGAMRIASLLVNMPASRVYSFYSAACAIGIMEAGVAVRFNEKTVEPKKHRDHTLFGKILKRLRTGNSEFEA